MKYYIISGERSGDLHASNLITAIRKLDPQANLRGMGGDYSEQANLSLVAHYDDVALMGFVEVLFGFRKVLKYLKLVKEDILAFQPDAVILVDYGGFNMKIAKFCHEKGIPVHYYISPKVWAWNQKRAFKLKKYVDHLYCILPFEPEFFKRFDWDVNYVGNPLLDEMAKFTPHDFFHQKNELSYKPIIALLPGSRRQEVDKMMQTMVDIVPLFSNAQFIIAGVRNLPEEVYQNAIDMGVKVIFDQTYDLLYHANAAIVTSGTATLETALFRVPQVVVYRTSGISYAIAKNLIKVPFISLVNLIVDKEVVRELIQGEYNKEVLLEELRAILGNAQRKAEILEGYNLVRELLGNKSASQETAKMIVESIKK
ncbi:lipid-A-disaccharide synthase [Echinicola marina]|uniref:lipid-A-disaccharide synthase n=1 Tax=Echinicola marina TaxID=2859768 RepID=UPI001CF66C6B|nr:lipid-A-disaccharide synthase [Echinicola marina]UCS93417.1 lipid-A-disaccharide synthase [Echinicola marina]